MSACQLRLIAPMANWCSCMLQVPCSIGTVPCRSGLVWLARRSVGGPADVACGALLLAAVRFRRRRLELVVAGTRRGFGVVAVFGERSSELGRVPCARHQKAELAVFAFVSRAAVVARTRSGSSTALHEAPPVGPSS